MAALVAPLLQTMSKAARIAWPFIEGGVERGMSANAIIDALREAEVGVRRQDVLALVREARGAALIRSDLERLPRDIVLGPERVREAITKITAPYSYRVEVEAVNPDTGEVEPFTFTAHSQELRPFEEVEDDFVSQSPEDYPLPGYEIVSARVTDVVRAGVAGVI